MSEIQERDFWYLIWLLDQIKSGKKAQLPSGNDPNLLKFADQMGEPHFLPDWEIEAICNQFLLTQFAPKRGRTRAPTAALVGTLVNSLRDIDNEQGKQQDPSFILEEMSRIAARQIPFQRNPFARLHVLRWWGMVRDTELRKALETKYGAEVKFLFRCFLGLWRYFDAGAFMRAPVEVDADLMPTDTFLRVMSVISAPIEEARRQARTLLPQGLTYDRQSLLRQSPVLSFPGDNRNGVYCAPNLALLLRRVTSGLYYDVTAAPMFQNLIGNHFETHVRKLIAFCFGSDLKPKEHYPTLSGTAEEPDVVVEQSGKAVLIGECKATKANLAAQISLISEGKADRAISEFAKGAFQLARYQAYASMKNAVLVDCPLVLFVQDEWLFLAPTFRDKIFEAAEKIAASNSLVLPALSQKAIAFCPIGDFEEMVCTLSNESILKTLSAAGTSDYAGWVLRGLAQRLGHARLEVQRQPMSEDLGELIEDFELADLAARFRTA